MFPKTHTHTSTDKTIFSIKFKRFFLNEIFFRLNICNILIGFYIIRYFLIIQKLLNILLPSDYRLEKISKHYALYIYIISAAIRLLLNFSIA